MNIPKLITLFLFFSSSLSLKAQLSLSRQISSGDGIELHLAIEPTNATIDTLTFKMNREEVRFHKMPLELGIDLLSGRKEAVLDTETKTLQFIFNPAFGILIFHQLTQKYAPKQCSLSIYASNTQFLPQAEFYARIEEILLRELNIYKKRSTCPIYQFQLDTERLLDRKTKLLVDVDTIENRPPIQDEKDVIRFNNTDVHAVFHWIQNEYTLIIESPPFQFSQKRLPFTKVFQSILLPKGNLNKIIQSLHKNYFINLKKTASTRDIIIYSMY